MNVLVCGSRNWTDRVAIRRELATLTPGTVVIHRAAWGADHLADVVARELGVRVVSCPPDWKRYGRAAGLRRNQEMLAAKPDLVLPFAALLEESRGTRDMVRRATEAGLEVRVFPS